MNKNVLLNGVANTLYIPLAARIYASENFSHFYQVDLPEVIDLRKKVLGNSSNEKLISEDMFALDWIKEIDISLPTMIVVSGVYQYFRESKIIDMIKKMKLLISKGELIFDVTNSKGLKLANKYVTQTGNEDAQMYFSIDNPKEFADCTNTKLVEVTGFFWWSIEALYRD